MIKVDAFTLLDKIRFSALIFLGSDRDSINRGSRDLLGIFLTRQMTTCYRARVFTSFKISEGRYCQTSSIHVEVGRKTSGFCFFWSPLDPPTGPWRPPLAEAPIPIGTQLSTPSPFACFSCWAKLLAGKPTRAPAASSLVEAWSKS